MEVSRINCATPFKAKVESQSPLVSGNWNYLVNPDSKANETGKTNKKSSFLKKALITAAVVIVAGYGFAKARGLESIKAVMDKGFKDNQGFMNKTKWVVGKIGDYAITAYNATVGKVVKWVKGFKKANVADTSAPAAAPSPASASTSAT